MPERRDSVDSFDDFFGVPKTDDDRKKSPVKPKENDTSIAAIVKTQPVISRPRTPSTPEERILSTPKTKPKVNNTITTSTKNEYKNEKNTPPSLPGMSSRAESVQSKTYESDFDDDNGYEDDVTAIESTDERKKHSSVPPPKQRISDAPRRGSDSELKSSFTTTHHNKPPNGNTRRKEPLLPYIRPQQNRRTVYPVRRRRESITSSIKNELEQRAQSAKHNKLKLLESRLAELRRELEAQRIENSTLRTIQIREEKAIKKYEDKEYDIHRIVRDYNHEIDHIKDVLTNERDTKVRLERQVEARDEKLRDQTKRLQKYEKIVQEKNLDERYQLHEKLNEIDKKLLDAQEKLSTQEKHIENLEKNHRYEINQELAKQRELKRELEKRSEKYSDLMLKFEDKTRQVDTMHIYVQRGGKRPSDTTSDLSKSRSLQSLQDTSPRLRTKINDYDKQRREKQEQERKSKPRQQPPSSNDSSPIHDKKKLVPKKEPQPAITTAKHSSHTLNDEKPSTMQNGHLPPKGKAPARRLSTPRSVEEEKSEIEDETLNRSESKKSPQTTIQRGEQQLSHAQIHKRQPVSETKYTPSGTGGSKATSSIFKLTEPPGPTSKSRATRDLDEKWSDMFGTNKQEDSTKEDLLSKLISDEQQERRQAAAQPPPSQRPSMTMFESSTRSTTTQPTTTTVKPSVDPFESLFGNDSSKPTASRTNDLDDIFSTKPSTQTTTQTKHDSFDSLFGPSSTANNLTTANSNSRQISSQNDKLQRPKVVTNPTRSIPNRTIIDEVEEFVL